MDWKIDSLAIVALLLTSCGAGGDSLSQIASGGNVSTSASLKSHEEYDGVKVYCDPTWDNIYAWVDENGKTNELLGPWPGKTLLSSGDWKYYEFPERGSLNLIFNNSSGQTPNLSIDQKGVYYYHGSKWYKEEPDPNASSSVYSPEIPFPAISESNYRTFYQLLVYSFADGNGDGIGDFKGIIDHLDYLSDLGIGAIWLSPVQPSDSYHSYDCTDYYSIKSTYEVTVGGKKYDFETLLEECHKKDIKIVMDMVFNHTSRNHTWYNQHRNWYGSDNKFGFPEFDFDKTEVRDAIKDVGRYWLNQGVDGFRLDAAYWVYNSGIDRDAKNFAWWQEFSTAMKETKPDCYLIGEVLDSNHDLAFDYTACGFDSTFDFEAPRQTYEAFSGNANRFAYEISSDQEKIAAINPNAIMARALSNHDIGRFSQEHPVSSDAPYYIESPLNQLKLANALNILTPGNAFVYYGDELGLKASARGYQDQSYRTPMPFETGQTNSVVYFEGFHDTGTSTWTTASGQTIAVDQANPLSVYNVMKKAISIKKNYETLQKGSVESYIGINHDLIEYHINNGDETLHLYCNTKESGSLAVEASGTLKETLVTSNETVQFSNGSLVLPACSIAILK